MISNNDKILHKNNRILIQNETLVSVPTFIIIGDSNADGRLILEKLSGSRYNSEWANDLVRNDKPSVKIFASNTTGKFRVLNIESANVYNSTYNAGFEQTIGYGLAKHYGNQQIRIIKYGLGSTTAGGSSTFSWQPGEEQMDIFEAIYANAIIEAAKDGESLNLIACITFLGTNDAENLTLANNYEANMTTVVNHLRENVFEADVPMIVTSCTEGTTYGTTVRAAQVSLCANVDGCTYFNLHRFGRGSVHPLFAGVFTGGLEIARTIITGLLSGTDYMDDFIFSFQTNRNGSFSLALSINELINTGFYIDWGDGGAETEIDARIKTYTHTFTDGTTKTVKIKMMCPWNFFQLTLDSSNSGIVGTLNCIDLTGLDDFTISNNNSGLIALTDPRTNYALLACVPSNAFVQTGISAIDFKRYGYRQGLSVYGASPLSVIDTSAINKWIPSIYITACANLVSVDLSSFYVTSNAVYIYNNPKLATLKLSKSNLIMAAIFWCSGNTILTEIQNYQYGIYVTSYDVRNCDLSRTNVDNIINEMWNRARDIYRYYTQANKTAYFTGNNGVTGTFDGTTDWSGGLPTSPAAKAYDLLNDVTGTYNFSTFSI